MFVIPHAWPIICKLLHKACERLRSHGLLTGALTMQLAYYRGVAWGPEIRFPETDSTVFLMRALDRIWKDRPEPRSPILQVGVVLTRLCEQGNFTPELFQTAVADAMAGGDEKQKRLDATLDKLRARYPLQSRCQRVLTSAGLIFHGLNHFPHGTGMICHNSYESE